MNYQDKLIDNPNYNGITLKKLFESSMEDLPFMQMQSKGASKEKQGDGGVSDWDNGSAAFLGPQLWEKTIPCSSDLKFECMDLDEFLNENELEDEFFHKNQLFGGQNSKNAQPQDVDRLSPTIGTSDFVTSLVTEADLDSQDRSSPVVKNSPKFAMSPERDIGSPASGSEYNSDEEGPDFDPRKRPFSEEELKPQPMMKKSRKQYVPNDLKDDKYWARRRKNNLAAKRSRDARRVKENQIVLRANFLEKENDDLKEELEKTRKLLEVMKKKLAVYEGTQS